MRSYDTHDRHFAPIFFLFLKKIKRGISFFLKNEGGSWRGHDQWLALQKFLFFLKWF